MSTMYSWLVQTADHGLVQVDADRVSLLSGGATFYASRKLDGEYLLCSFAPGKWASIEIMSQATGYGNGFTRIEDNKAKGRGKK